jgi:hypothetical protein
MSVKISGLVPAVTVLLVVGLGGTTAGCTSRPSAPATNTSAASVENAAPPSSEGTGAEAPQAPVNQPAVHIASLPIGGNIAEEAGNPQCFTISWAGASFASGIRVRIDGVRVTGDFHTNGDCQNQRSCQGFLFSADSQGGCGVTIGWPSTPPAGASSSDTQATTVELHGRLLASGTCVGPDQDTCQRWVAQIDQSSPGIELSVTLSDGPS